VSFFDYTFWNNTILDYVICLGALLASIVLLLIIKRILVKRLERWAKKTPTTLDDLLIRSVKKHLMPLLFVAAVYFNLKWLTLTPIVQRVVDIAALAFVAIFGAVVISTLFIFLFNKSMERKKKKPDKLVIKWIGTLIRFVIWVIALLLFLDNIGVNITTLVAGLGIGGIAIAFAAQAVLEDVFSFFSILFDKPFELDDLIEVDDMIGEVEHIGIKTTRMRSMTGEQIVFSNKDITSSRVHNYKRMENRRIAFPIGVTYDTPTETLKEIPKIIEQIIVDQPGTTFGRAHFKEFGDFSLNFEIVYYVLDRDFMVHMDKREEINLLIMDAFVERGIEFAFPTQTLYVEK